MQDVAVPIPHGLANVWHRPPVDDASTAVLVHGLSGNSRWWTRVIDHMPAGLGLIVPDVRGRGGSVDAPPPYDLATLADDISRSLDHFEVDTAVVAGYSMGAWIAALFGLHHPERAERLVLVDGGLPLPRDPSMEVDELIDSLVGPALARLELEFDTEEDFYDHWRGHPALTRHWEDSMRAALGHELRAGAGPGLRVVANRDAIRVGARELTEDPIANEAAVKGGVPAHLIVVERGTLDQPGGMVPLDAANETARARADFSMEYLLGVNHYTLLLGDGASAVAAAISPV